MKSTLERTAMLLALAAGAFGLAAETAAPLKVCATVPDLGQLAQEVGGEEVSVVVFARGVQDPHFLEARPSFIKELSRADLFIAVGLELEQGWAPNLVQGARNARVLLGAAGYLDASSAITPLDAPAGIVDRSLGDVHPFGNPHYLLDPLAGLQVARAIRNRLQQLRPERKDYFSSRFDDFSSRLGAALVGEKLAGLYDVEKLAPLAERGKLIEFLRGEKQETLLGGWIGRLERTRGAPLVADHNLWPYFARRFGLRVVGSLEPKPGIAPTTRHLGDLAKLMKVEKVRAILTVPYFNVRHARVVAGETGSAILEMAHQCGGRPGTDSYLALIEHNVAEVERALR